MQQNKPTAMIQFPLLNISEKRWTADSWYESFVWDDYICSDTYFDIYLRGKLFCDCSGKVYQISHQILPTAWWRKVFRFLPNVYKIELVFKEVPQSISLAELKEYVLVRIGDLPADETRAEWKRKVVAARTFEEVISGDKESA